MKFPLRRCIIAATGDFGQARTHDKLKQWTEHNGGKFVREISGLTTHLICSKEHYKGRAPLGNELSLSTERKGDFLTWSVCVSGRSQTNPIDYDSNLRLAGRLLDETETYA